MSDINVFIMTKEGTSYSKKGIEYLKQRIRKEFSEHRRLVFIHGAYINRTDTMIKLLSDDNESFVVMSLPDDIVIISPKDNYKLKALLEEFPGESCWDIWCKHALGREDLLV